MGEILRHAEVTANTVQKARNIRPDEEFDYLELGNFLTDISQFRDPMAYMQAKAEVWRIAKSENGVLDVISKIPILSIITTLVLDAAGIKKWIDGLLGEHTPNNRRYGQLANYFEKIFLAVTHLIFADNIKNRPLVANLLNPLLKSLANVPETELNRLFSRYYTQYYPHEHTDFPPYVLSGSQRSRAAPYQLRASGLIAYLEYYMQYLTEELSKLEAQWKARRGLPKTHPDRHDILVSFGKLLHGVEDYFFHSNFVELHLWNDLRHTRSSAEPDDVFKRWFTNNALAKYRTYQGYKGYAPGEAPEDPEAGNIDRWRRRLMRRLRYPLYKNGNDLSKEASIPNLTTIVTGGFESKDMFHTMAEALESLEIMFGGLDNQSWLPPELRAKLPSKVLTNSDIVLIRALFNAEERTKMASNDAYRASRLVLHNKQIHSGVYEIGLKEYMDKGYLNQSALDAFRQAVRIDVGLEDSNARTPGVGGFLIEFLASAQKEVNNSRKFATQLDTSNSVSTGANSVFDERTDDNASSETIGTHTLLSKDTPKSQPLYEDARALAKYASLAVATRMLTEVTSSSDITSGLDWDKILKSYMRFPAASPNMWETQVLSTFRRGGQDPAYDDIADRPDFPKITLNGPDGKMVGWQNGTARTRLEKLYIDLEAKVDR